MNRLIVLATDSNGEGVANELLQFEIIDPEGTGAVFLIGDDDREIPVTTTHSVTGGNGFAVLEDKLMAGSRPGKVTICITAPFSEGNANATITRVISAQTPAKIEKIFGGDESFPIESYVLVNVKVRILDTANQPIPYGAVRLSIYDPFETGTILAYPKSQIIFYDLDVSTDGYAEKEVPVRVGSKNPGQEFFIRMDRKGQKPEYLFSYTAMK